MAHLHLAPWVLPLTTIPRTKVRKGCRDQTAAIRRLQKTSWIYYKKVAQMIRQFILNFQRNRHLLYIQVLFLTFGMSFMACAEDVAVDPPVENGSDADAVEEPIRVKFLDSVESMILRGTAEGGSVSVYIVSAWSTISEPMVITVATEPGESAEVVLGRIAEKIEGFNEPEDELEPLPRPAAVAGEESLVIFAGTEGRCYFVSTDNGLPTPSRPTNAHFTVDDNILTITWDNSPEVDYTVIVNRAWRKVSGEGKVEFDLSKPFNRRHIGLNIDEAENPAIYVMPFLEVVAGERATVTKSAVDMEP